MSEDEFNRLFRELMAQQAVYGVQISTILEKIQALDEKVQVLADSHVNKSQLSEVQSEVVDIKKSLASWVMLNKLLSGAMVLVLPVAISLIIGYVSKVGGL